MTESWKQPKQHKLFHYFEDPEVEREFQTSYSAEIGVHLRAGSYVSLFGWLFTLLVIYFVLPEHFGHLLRVIGLTICPFLALVAYATYRPSWSKHSQWLGGVSNAFAGVLWVYLGHFVPHGHYVAGLLIAYVISFGAYMSRLRMSYAFLASLPYVIFFQLDLLFGYPSIPKSDLYVLSAFLWMVELTAISASSIGEQNSRTLFAQGRALREQKSIQENLNHKLQEASAHKSKFLAGMSHELRTPLNAIIGFTRIVRRKAKDALPEKQIENLDKILSSSQHLLSLINDILDLSKIEAGRVELELGTFVLTEVIQSSVHTAQPLLQEGVSLHTNIAPGLVPIHSDRAKLGQIVLNLLSNAAKFTHEGEITVHIKPAFDGEMLQVSVQDTGIGMTQEVLGKIFDEFQQADSSTTRKYGGTGLGLSISKKLAELMGGTLEVESTVGKGSTFTLTLPVKTASSTDES